MIYSPIWWIGDWWPPDSSPDCVDLESCVGHNTCWLHVCECCLPLWWMSSWMNNEQYTMTTSMRMVEMITDNAADEQEFQRRLLTLTPQWLAVWCFQYNPFHLKDVIRRARLNYDCSCRCWWGEWWLSAGLALSTLKRKLSPLLVTDWFYS